MVKNIRSSPHFYTACILLCVICDILDGGHGLCPLISTRGWRPGRRRGCMRCKRCAPAWPFNVPLSCRTLALFFFFFFAIWPSAMTEDVPVTTESKHHLSWGEQLQPHPELRASTLLVPSCALWNKHLVALQHTPTTINYPPCEEKGRGLWFNSFLPLFTRGEIQIIVRAHSEPGCSRRGGTARLLLLTAYCFSCYYLSQCVLITALVVIMLWQAVKCGPGQPGCHYYENCSWVSG